MYHCFIIDSDEENNEKCLRDLKKHLSAEDKEILFQGSSLLDDGSSQSFEREMENEAQNHVNGVHVAESAVSCPVSPDAFIDTSLPSTSKTQEQINDELFYDPDADELDQIWVDSHRKRCFPNSPPASTSTDLGSSIEEEEHKKKLKSAAQLKKEKSDATLNCPCCLTLLCLDCQRHEIYKTQYRAMFVHNCHVDFTKKMLRKNKILCQKQYKRSKKFQFDNKDTSNSSITDVYYPVQCTSCNTNVAVFDTDGVFHFFSVIASH